MCSSSVTLFPATKKACSGKCMGSCKSVGSQVWVVAACNGMLSLFEKRGEHLTPIGSDTSFSSLEAFSHFLRGAAEREEFSQLMIIGSEQDVAWAECALPEEAARKLVAEMKYPLLPGWFSQMSQLTAALERVLHP